MKLKKSRAFLCFKKNTSAPGRRRTGSNDGTLGARLNGRNLSDEGAH